MSLKLDRSLEATGTKFRIFPQPRFLAGITEPELIRTSVPPEQMHAGPADDRMFVVDAIDKEPYSEFELPPYRGPANPAVRPGPDGHFDRFDPNSREFLCATMYATCRRTLDIWEDYFGHRIDWMFEADFSRMEMIPLVEWDNAHSGYGFLEFGFGRKVGGGIDHTRPYCENYDVLSHELGHSIIFSQVGVPRNPPEVDSGIDYGGMQESSGDLVAIVSVLHFDSIVNRLLNSTRGNLFTVNELDRVGELSDSRQIRIAFNYERMSDVGDEPHDRSLPLTGGIFDIMVEVFQKKLVAAGLITNDLAKRSGQDVADQDQLAALQAEFNVAFEGREAGFKQALLEARDYLGELLARTWKLLSPDFLTYPDIVRALLKADKALTQGANQDTIRSCFAWREIRLPRRRLLQQLHDVTQCGLNGRTSKPRLSELTDEALSEVIRVANVELDSRNKRSKQAYGGMK